MNEGRKERRKSYQADDDDNKDDDEEATVEEEEAWRVLVLVELFVGFFELLLLLL